MSKYNPQLTHASSNQEALLLVDHGSKKDAANQMLSHIATMVAEKSPLLIVEIAHMELASPTIEEGIAQCIKKGATHITIHPYMLAPGRHATQDIPNMAKTALESYPHITYTITPPLGTHPLIATIILDRMKETI